MIYVGVVCALMLLTCVILSFGVCLKCIIELFREHDYILSIFVFGLWLIGLVGIIVQLISKLRS